VQPPRSYLESSGKISDSLSIQVQLPQASLRIWCGCVFGRLSAILKLARMHSALANPASLDKISEALPNWVQSLLGATCHGCASGAPRAAQTILPSPSPHCLKSHRAPDARSLLSFAYALVQVGVLETQMQ